jgi:hypothetical protein
MSSWHSAYLITHRDNFTCFSTNRAIVSNILALFRPTMQLQPVPQYFLTYFFSLSVTHNLEARSKITCALPHFWIQNVDCWSIVIIIVTYSRYAWHSLPRQRWRNKSCRYYGNGQVNTPLNSPRWRGSDSHCDVTRDTAVDSDNRQPATGNKHRYKKPAEQHVELVCDEEPPKSVCD